MLEEQQILIQMVFVASLNRLEEEQITIGMEFPVSLEKLEEESTEPSRYDVATPLPTMEEEQATIMMMYFLTVCLPGTCK